jgi:hypothetical protein
MDALFEPIAAAAGLPDLVGKLKTTRLASDRAKEIQGIPTLIKRVSAPKRGGPKKNQTDRCLPTKASPPRPAVALPALSGRHRARCCSVRS